MHRNLGEFIATLREHQELIEVNCPINPHLEIPEVHRRVIAANGPALLFTNIKGSQFPVITNLFGSKKRIDLAFGKEPGKFIETLASFPEELMPPKLSTLWQHKGALLKSLKIGTKTIRNAPVLKRMIANADLSKLPTLTSWPEDGGPFITLPLVHTKGTNKKSENLGMYRIQIHSKSEAGMHFQIGKGGGFHYFEAEKQNKALTANIYLGGPPSLMLSAIAPLPENIPELLLASLCQGNKLHKSKVKGHPLDPISETEFAILGSVAPHTRKPEGPFGDHYGYYSLKHDYPVFKPSAIYHRQNPVFPATIVGKPKQEDFYLGDYLQELLSPLFPLVMPAVKDLWSYGETGYHSLSATCLKERYSRESMSSVFRILGEGQLSLTKFLIGIDKNIDLKDFKSVLTYALERVDWRKDLYVFSELSMDTLDYSGPQVNHGSKGVLLGMGEAIRSLPRLIENLSTNRLIKKAICFSPGCLVVEVPSFTEDKDCINDLVTQAQFKDWPLIIAVDNAEKACMTDSSFLWTCFTRFEPAADIYAKSYKNIRHHLSYEGPIAIDARMKPWYPKELFCDQTTKELVSQRWNQYFPERNVAMGSSDTAHLEQNNC